MISLQAKTIRWFREGGYIVGTVESRKQFPNRERSRCRQCGNVPMISISHDLWNCFDLLACYPVTSVPKIVLIQVTSAANHAIRRTKILTSAEARFWLMAGGEICIQSWQKERNRWRPRIEWLDLDQFPRNLPETVDEFYEGRRREKLGEYPENTDLFTQDEVPF